MTVVGRGDVVIALELARARSLELTSLDDAIIALEMLAASLDQAREPADDDGPGPNEPLRTVLSAHLLAVHALRDIHASDDAIAKVVRRAIDGAEQTAAALT